MSVEAILKAKGHRVITVKSDTSVAGAAQRLRLERIGALVVSDDGRSVLGLVSERDIVHDFAQHGADAGARRVAEVMAREVPTCAPADRLKDVMSVMTRRRARHMPVVQDGALAGIVSLGDVVKTLLDDMELERSVLRDALRARQ